MALIKTTKNTLFGFLSLLTLLFLTACESGSTDTTDDNALEGTQGSLAVTVTDSDGDAISSLTVGNSAIISATFTDASDNDAVAEQRIDFSANSGTLSESSRLTNSSGQTSVTLNTTDVTPGVITVTISTTYNDETLTKEEEIEVLAATSEVVGDPNLTMSLEINGETTVEIEENESAQLKLTVLDADNAPVTNTQVTFSAELGTLNSTSDLTDGSGVAEVTLTGTAEQLGVATATALVTINDITYSETYTYQVVESGTVTEEDSVSIGYFDTEGNFVDGEIGLSLSGGSTSISAGATLGLNVVLVNQNLELITTPSSVSFTSTCVAAEQATIDTPVTTINGKASSTYEDINCAGASGNEDEIVATITSGTTTLTATTTIQLQPEGLGSIEFVSASPESIVLKGTGGQGKQETSTMTFLVKGELGNPLNQQNVTFELNTAVGGLSLASTSGVTNSEGLVTANVVLSQPLKAMNTLSMSTATTYTMMPMAAA